MIIKPKVRKINSKDIKQISKLGNKEKYFKGFYSEEILKNIAKNKKDCIILVCVIDEEIVGFVLAIYSKTLSRSIWECSFVKKDYRSQKYFGEKISEILAKSLFKYLKEKKVKIVSGIIDKKNIPSQKYVKRLGFKIYREKYFLIEKDIV